MRKFVLGLVILVGLVAFTALGQNQVVAGNTNSQLVSQKEYSATPADDMRSSGTSQAGTDASVPKWATIVLDILDDTEGARPQ